MLITSDDLCDFSPWVESFFIQDLLPKSQCHASTDTRITCKTNIQKCPGSDLLLFRSALTRRKCLCQLLSKWMIKQNAVLSKVNVSRGGGGIVCPYDPYNIGPVLYAALLHFGQLLSIMLRILGLDISLCYHTLILSKL